MPLNAKGRKIMAAMKEQYGEEEGERNFYASKNKGAIEGVDALDGDGVKWTRGVSLNDFGEARKIHRTPDGYLAAEARVSRVGTQRYRGAEVGLPDQESVVLYRPEEEVFSRAAMHSMAHKPITLTHPKSMVDRDSWTKVVRGFSSSPVVRDGEFVRVPLMLADAEAIDAFEKQGVKQLSVGYTTDIDWTPGVTPDGEKYDGVQRSIHANHHALVPRARGGERLAFGDQERDQGERECPNCGARVSGFGMTCPSCGYELDPLYVPAGGSTGDEDTYLKGKAMNGDDDDDGDGKKRPFKGAAKPFKADDAWPETEFYDRDVSEEERKDLAEKGHALPGGGFPIKNVGDLRNAVKAFGRAKNPSATKALIKRRAKELGAESELPDDWKSSTQEDHMSFTGMFDGVTVAFADERSQQIVDRHIAKLQKAIRDQAKKNDDDDEDAVKAEQDREKKERGWKDSIAAKDGEIAVLKQKLTDAAVTPEALTAMLAERYAVIDAARQFLRPDYVYDNKSLPDIRRAAVGVKLGDQAIKDWGDAQITGAFMAYAQGVGVAQPARRGAWGMADGMSADMAQMGGRMSGNPNPRATSDAAYDESVKATTEAWKARRPVVA